MVTIWHNPKCSKSREALALIQAKGIEPHIVEYLKGGLTAEKIAQLIAESGLSVRQAIRADNKIYLQTIKDKGLAEMEIIALIAANPSLLNRPFVETENGVRLCRPPELVHQIL